MICFWTILAVGNFAKMTIAVDSIALRIDENGVLECLD